MTDLERSTDGTEILLTPTFEALETSDRERLKVLTDGRERVWTGLQEDTR